MKINQVRADYMNNIIRILDIKNDITIRRLNGNFTGQVITLPRDYIERRYFKVLSGYNTLLWKALNK